MWSESWGTVPGALFSPLYLSGSVPCGVSWVAALALSSLCAGKDYIWNFSETCFHWQFGVFLVTLINLFHISSVQFSRLAQLCLLQLSRVWLCATPWISARQASLSITNTRSSLRLTSIESVMPSSHLILCHPLVLLPPIPPSIRVFSNESALCIELLRANSLKVGNHRGSM